MSTIISITASLPGITGVQSWPCALLSSAVNDRTRKSPDASYIVKEPLEGMLYLPKPRFIETAFLQETLKVQRSLSLPKLSQIPFVAGVIEVVVGTAKAGA
ncbi:MAG TPA: hypothetical protein EYN11_06045 [Phycisphaerales bacterium]|nr:hypothetical protein [Phycisphaerales bacterium]